MDNPTAGADLSRAPAEERRIVTVLFADVAGSTAMGEDIDAEELRRLLARYYAIARELIAEHGGTLEKFIGDAVMAVFGLPTAHGAQLSEAIGIWEGIGAIPSLGRARAERGLITHDRIEMDAGLRLLRALGDVNYVDRFSNPNSE